MNIEAALKEAMGDRRGRWRCLVDWDSGMSLGQLGGGKCLDRDVAAAGNTEVVQAKMRHLSRPDRAGSPKPGVETGPYLPKPHMLHIRGSDRRYALVHAPQTTRHQPHLRRNPPSGPHASRPAGRTARNRPGTRTARKTGRDRT